MIKWCDSLYIDKKIKAKKKKYMKILEAEKITIGLYCITLPINNNNLFDIISSNELLFNYYKKKNIYVIGLAKDKDSAIALLVNIIEDIYRETKDLKVKEYFSFS
jgi:hypothetical protein